MTTIDRATFEALQQMHASSGLPAPDPASYTLVDAPPAAAAATPGVPSGASAAPAWDTTALAGLDEQTRAGVMAGMAGVVGRQAVEHAASSVLVRPEDVHLHLTEPERYVDAQGNVDRAAIDLALRDLVTSRPELDKRHAYSPDARRYAAPLAPGQVGPGATGPAQSVSGAVETIAAQMRRIADRKP